MDRWRSVGQAWVRQKNFLVKEFFSVKKHFLVNFFLVKKIFLVKKFFFGKKKCWSKIILGVRACLRACVRAQPKKFVDQKNIFLTKKYFFDQKYFFHQKNKKKSFWLKNFFFTKKFFYTTFSYQKKTKKNINCTETLISRKHQPCRRATFPEGPYTSTAPPRLQLVIKRN